MSNSKQKRYEDNLRRSVSKTSRGNAMAKVLSFDSGTMTATVQPISKRMVNGNYESQPPILKVPVAHNSGGGFCMTAKYNVGDVVSISYMDHSIDSALASGEECDPNMESNHSASDAVITGGIAAGSGPPNDLPEGSYGFGQAGLYIVILDGKINIKGDVIIEGSVNVTGDFSVKGDFSVSGNVGIGGSLRVSGSIIESGDNM